MGGDLARMLGIADDLAEHDRKPVIPPWHAEVLEPLGTYVAPGGDPAGPSLTIFGDSFTSQAFGRLEKPGGFRPDLIR
jgi:hypothetical protein